MEFEALEDEVSAIHGDLWEQLNAGGQVKSHAVIIIVCFNPQFVWEIESLFPSGYLEFDSKSGLFSPEKVLFPHNIVQPLHVGSIFLTV